MRGRARGRSSGPLFRSLRLRMGVSHGLVLALILVLMGGTGYLLLARSLNRGATASVVEAAKEATERVSSSRSPVNIRPDDDVPSATTIRVAAFLNDGRVVSDPGRRPSWLRPQREPTTTLSVLGERVRIATVPLRQDGGVIGQVVAARSLAPEDRLLDRVRLLLLLGGLLAVLLGMLAGWVLANRSGRMIANDYPLGFKVALHRKDLGIALELAGETGAVLPIAALCDQLESGLIGRGHGDEDLSAVARSIRELSGLEG